MSDEDDNDVGEEGGEEEEEEEVKDSKKRKVDGGEKKSAASGPVGDSDTRILNYMIQQNRPYSVQQVFDNLQRAVKKAEVPRSLDRLTEQGKLTMKLFKKVKIYMANQDACVPLAPEELARLDTEIVTLTEQAKVETAALSKMQHEVGALSGQMSDADVATAIFELKQQIEERKARLAALKGNAHAVSGAEIAKRQQKFNKYFLEWKKRKRAVKEMLDTYMENAPKSMTPKKFMSENGLETDEEAKVDMAVWEKLFKK